MVRVVGKGDRPRLVSLRVSPGFAGVLAALREASGGDAAAGRVWPRDPARVDDWTLRCWRDSIVERGGPRVTWQQLRQSCASWLACVDGIFGDVSHAMGLAQLGHSFAVAARYYLAHDRALTRAASLDEAWGVGEVLGEIAEAVARR